MEHFDKCSKFLIMLRHDGRRRGGPSTELLTWWRGASTYLVCHHRAYLRLCSFSNACMRDAFVQLRARNVNVEGALEGSWILCGEHRSSFLQHLSSMTYSSFE